MVKWLNPIPRDRVDKKKFEAQFNNGRVSWNNNRILEGKRFLSLINKDNIYNTMHLHQLCLTGALAGLIQMRYNHGAAIIETSNYKELSRSLVPSKSTLKNNLLDDLQGAMIGKSLYKKTVRSIASHIMVASEGCTITENARIKAFGSVLSLMKRDLLAYSENVAIGIRTKTIYAITKKHNCFAILINKNGQVTLVHCGRCIGRITSLKNGFEGPFFVEVMNQTTPPSDVHPIICPNKKFVKILLEDKCIKEDFGWAMVEDDPKNIYTIAKTVSKRSARRKKRAQQKKSIKKRNAKSKSTSPRAKEQKKEPMEIDVAENKKKKEWFSPPIDRGVGKIPVAHASTIPDDYSDFNRKKDQTSIFSFDGHDEFKTMSASVSYDIGPFPHYLSNRR